MTTTVRIFLTRLATLLVAAWFAVTTAGCATAHSEEQAQVRSRAELEQLLAPVALYPDALLAQLLMAATYPDEIVEAARWSRMNPELPGEDAMRAADVFDWDPSVKSLIAFPDLLARMDEKIDWTRALGDAFLAQEDDVMDAVQDLRRRAQLAGGLTSDDHVVVTEEGPRIQIVFASPSVVYVPYYDPRVIYGRWWSPTHPPVVWAPWPGYRFVSHTPGATLGFWWNTGVRLSIGFFFGGIDWRQREVRVLRVDSWYVRHAIDRRAPQRKVAIVPGRWRHEPTRRYAEPRPMAHALPQPATQREPRRIDVRQPEPRRTEVHAADARQTQLRRPVMQQAESRPQVERKSEAQKTADRRAQPRQNEARADERKGQRTDARATPQPAPRVSRPAPQRDARGAETPRAQRERAQPSPRQAQAATPSAPRREAREDRAPRDAQRSAVQRETPASPQRGQAAERRGGRGASERGSQNADDAHDRRPQG
jgi:Protein of unknown function (DUF3300)